MKKLISMLTLCFCFILASCSTPGYGLLVTAHHSPGNYVVNIPQNNEVKFLKEGTGSIFTILWLFSVGDASIEGAMKDGKINKLHHVDNQTTIILGLIHVYTVHVYGE